MATNFYLCFVGVIDLSLLFCGLLFTLGFIIEKMSEIHLGIL